MGVIRKGSRGLEDKLVCAAPGNKATGQSQANEAGETVTRLTEKRSHKKNREGKKNRWKKITWRGRKEGESGGGVRMFEEVGVWQFGSLGRLGRLGRCGWWESGCSFQLQFPQFNCARSKVHESTGIQIGVSRWEKQVANFMEGL